MKINYESYSTKYPGNVCEIKNCGSLFAFFPLVQTDMRPLHPTVKWILWVGGKKKKGGIGRWQSNNKTERNVPILWCCFPCTEESFHVGEVKWNPARREVNEDGLQGKKVCFGRTASGGSFVASNVPKAPIPDRFPPCQITDLKAKIQGESLINLTWTAPGDDYDHGRGKFRVVWNLQRSWTAKPRCRRVWGRQAFCAACGGQRQEGPWMSPEIKGVEGGWNG